MSSKASERRRPLLERMAQLEVRGISCRLCSGECCTSRRNSMMITEEEAFDILYHLIDQKLWNRSLENRLLKCVREYRLDVQLPEFGSRRNIRRTYTCPFYSEGPRGCSLPREVKPFGCLGFNPTQQGAIGLQSGCQSDQALLAEAQGEVDPKVSKLPIPLAVLDAARKLDPRGNPASAS